jgi:uroporphyrinogen decarboxylase
MNPATNARTSGKKFLDVLSGTPASTPPMWLMRQAGRYLPEYRATRTQAGSFLDLCFNPKLAAEVTLQPIRRFGFDAAILFSDILVVPHAMGQTVAFEEGHGPRLSPRLDEAGIAKLDGIKLSKLDAVFEAIGLIKAALPSETALIGFCGAPWTVASYMVAGEGSRELATVRLFAFRYPKAFKALIDNLVEGSIEYLLEQAKAGVEAVQIFDSWASVLPSDEFEAWSIDPIARIVDALRARAPGLKIIAFPREAGANLGAFAARVKADCLGIGTAESIPVVKSTLPAKTVLQGNLDPLALLAGGDALTNSVRRIRREFGDAPYVFNLGHGILPETPIAHVEQLVKLVREPA